MIYLLDTNVLSEMQRNPMGEAAKHFRLLEETPDVVLTTSVIVASEMRFGALKKSSVSLQERVAELLSRIKVMPLEPGVDEFYAKARVELERKGTPIGGNDLLIAAHALALDAVLVTDNIREFNRIEGLRLENWLRP